MSFAIVVRYDSLLKRKVRVYVTRWRKLAQLVVLPASWLLLILAMCIFTLFAIWGGTYMMVLPTCSDCESMLEHARQGPEAFYALDPRPSTPYDRYKFDENSTFLQNRSFDAFIYGWSDNLTGIPPLNPEAEACLPTTCSQADTYLLFGTCWNKPSGLPWEGTPLFSFIIFTALIMRPITALFIMLYEMMIKCATKLENWPSLGAYNKHFLTRRFTSLWINSYWFNMALIFVITRFGPALNQYRYQRCRGIAQDFSNGTSCVVDSQLDATGDGFEIVERDYRASIGTNATNAFLDLLLKIPGADSSSSPGVWNPENPLIAGLWIGCLFDLILTQSTFILMVLSWPGFFAAACAKCCRSKDCCKKCCRCSAEPEKRDDDCETVESRADRVRAQSQDYESFVPASARASSNKKSRERKASSIVLEMTELTNSVKVTKEEGGGSPVDPSSVVDFTSAVPVVDHLRDYSRPELLRVHALSDFNKLAGVLDYPRMILLTLVVVVFTIFFPLLIIFVTGGVLLETQANLLGLMSFSRVAIPEASGDGRWTWMILWTQRAAIPIVMSYFVFTVLEFLACTNVEVRYETVACYTTSLACLYAATCVFVDLKKCRRRNWSPLVQGCHL